jgi:uncharacterized protein YdhG (YjbR/CyaY superfamily)
MTKIDEYLAGVPAPQKAELERIRKLVKRLVPVAEETIAYGMPAFKYKKQPLIYFAAFKDHLSLFPTSGPTEELADKLTAYRVSKGTIQFTLDNPLPDALVEEILTARLRAIES